MESLAEQAPARTDESLKERKRKIERWLFVAFVSGFTPLVFLIVGLIIYNVIILEGAVFKGLLFLTIILGPVTALALFFYREFLREVLAKSQRSQLSLSEPNAKLLPESHFEPISSVTEHTTEMLPLLSKVEANEANKVKANLEDSFLK